MLDPVFCTNCRSPIPEADLFCKQCGSDQRPPSRRTVTQETSTPVANAELEALKLEVERESRHLPRLIILGHRLTTTQQGKQFLIGVVQNDAHEECLQAQIHINILDADMSQIAAVTDQTLNIAAHGSWKFAIPVTFPGAQNYRIVDLRGTYETNRRLAEWQHGIVRRQHELIVAADVEAAKYCSRAVASQLEAERERKERENSTWFVWISFPI